MIVGWLLTVGSYRSRRQVVSWLALDKLDLAVPAGADAARVTEILAA